MSNNKPKFSKKIGLKTLEILNFSYKLSVPDKRLIALICFKEESPDSTRTQCQVIPGGGDPRDSATENKPP